jgi:hypothetical protein
MKIPVFVSGPTNLSPEQEVARKRIIKQLEHLNLEPRALGRSDYPTEFPLREVYIIAKHCSGGIILGFKQIQVTAGTIKHGTEQASEIEPKQPISIPSPWNHLEAGIMFGLRLPLLIFKEEGVSGGVFDNGVTDIFVHTLPIENVSEQDETALNAVFLKWYAKVSEHYYA